jgi:6-phosphogluconolactonase (cycloisomerase 2 family)
MSNYLYAMTNRQKANAVVGMKILKNGSLQFVKGSPFPTGGKGARSAESQNAVWIDQALLCAADVGSNSFAIFRRNPDGTLTRLNDKSVPSHGTGPSSVCISGGILYVLNKGNPTSGGKAPPYIAVFAVEGERVRYLPRSSVKLRGEESPRQVIVNRQGTLLAVPSMGAQGSLLHCYRINRRAASESGLLTELRDSPFAIADGDFGFGSAWKSDGKTFFMTNAVGKASVVRLTIDAASGKIAEDARAAAAGTACWAALGRGEEKLYVTNAESVLVFDVSGNGLGQVQSVDVADIPNSVLHDLILGPDGKFLYAIEQRKRRILVYSIAKDGRVTLRGERVIDAPSFPLGLAVG